MNDIKNQHAWSSNILGHIYKLFSIFILLRHRNKVYRKSNSYHKSVYGSVNNNKTDVLKITKYKCKINKTKITDHIYTITVRKELI